MTAPHWFDAEVTRVCERCDDAIFAGEPAAWLPADDRVACFECADQIEAALPPVPT